MLTKKRIYGMMLPFLAMASCREPLYTDETPQHIVPKEKPKTFNEELASKGLKEFEVCGETVIAHNSKEAKKRYISRHKNK